MGSGDSKPETTESATLSKGQNPFSQNDSLLDLLSNVAKQKDDEHKQSLDKLNKKLEHVLKTQSETMNGPNAAALLNLKYEKLKLKLKKQKELYETETKFFSTTRQIYMDQKEKLRILENEKTIQVANLNLDMAALNVEIDNLKQKVKDQEVSYKATLQAKDFEYSVLTTVVTDLKRKEQSQTNVQNMNFNLGVEIANNKREISALKLREQELQKTHEEKYNSLSGKYATFQARDCEYSTQQTVIADLKRKVRLQDNLASVNFNLGIEMANNKREISALKLRELELQKTHEEKYNSLSGKYNVKSNDIVSLREAHAQLVKEQSKYKREIMCIKTLNTDLAGQKASSDVKYNEIVAKYNPEVQKNRDLRAEVNSLNVLLTNNVKLTTLQQRGIFMEIKKSLEGLKVDLQYLVPHLSERTIPTYFQGHKEIENIDVLLKRHQDNLDRVIAYQGRYNNYVNTNQSLVQMEKTPNFLSSVELPCSFLHGKFLPLFRITFPTLESNAVQHNFSPRPLIDQPYYETNQRYSSGNNRGRGSNNRSREFVPRNQDQQDTKNPTNTNYRGRGGQIKKGRSRSQKNTNNSNEFKITGTNTTGDRDGESTSGVTLTVFTNSTNESGFMNKAATTIGRAVETTECIICCEPLRHNYKALEDCMHKFHPSCISDWFESNTECPECAREDY